MILIHCLEKGSSNSNVQLRTKKLFYVCITRAKKNLIIYMPTSDILGKAKRALEKKML